MNNPYLLIAVLLLLSISTYTYPTTTITDIPPNFSLLCDGNKPIRVNRYHAIRYTYQLVGVKGRWCPWTNYPQFNDHIQLQFAQYVRMTYSITVSFWPVKTNLLIRLLINNRMEQRMTTVTSDQHERTNFISQLIWLQAGNYQLQLQYMIGEPVPPQNAGSVDWIVPYFQIQYYNNR